MIRYIIRRLLWGVLLLIIVAALMFVLFRVLPTANPALLRAGRDPQPKLVKEIEGVLGLNKPLTVQFWDYMKGIFLHFNFEYSYYNQESVTGLIRERLPATLSLTIGAGDPVDRGRRLGGDHLGAAPPLVHRPRGDGRCAGGDLGARILARPGVPVPVRR